MTHSEQFAQYLHDQEIHMERHVTEEGDPYFLSEQQLDEGISIRLAINFYTGEHTVVEIWLMGLAELRNNAKIDGLMKLFNDFNTEKRFSTFMLVEEKFVDVNGSLLFIDNFNPEVILETCRIMLEDCEELYPTIMGYIWS